MNQPTLPWGARITDPLVSHEADQSMRGEAKRKQHALILRNLVALGRYQDDFTPWDAWVFMSNRLLGFDAKGYEIRCPKENVISKRFGEMRDEGWLRLTGDKRPGSTSRNQQVHEITEAGRAVLAAYVSERGAA